MGTTQHILSQSKSFARGACIGGVLCFVIAATTRRRIILWTGVGAIAGGFLATKFSDNKAIGEKEVASTKFKNYDLES